MAKGYRFFHNFVLLRKTIAKRFKAKLKDAVDNWPSADKKKIVNGIMSYWGWLKHGDCKTLFDKYVDFRVHIIMEVCCFTLRQRNPLRRIT